MHVHSNNVLIFVMFYARYTFDLKLQNRFCFNDCIFVGQIPHSRLLTNIFMQLLWEFSLGNSHIFRQQMLTSSQIESLVIFSYFFAHYN